MTVPKYRRVCCYALSRSNTEHRQVSCVPIRERFSCGEGVYDVSGDDVGEVIVGWVCTSIDVVFE